MKTNKNLKKIAPAFMLVLLIAMLVFSCNKDNPETDPEEPLTPSGQPDVFSNKPVNIMSEYETTNNLLFPGHRIHKLGNGLMGGTGHNVWEGAHFIGELVWEAYDYHHTEANFKDIEDQLDDITGQIAELNANIISLARVMAVDFNKLNAHISTQALNDQIAYVETAMGDATSDELMWYSEVATRYQADTSNPQNKKDMEDLKLYAPLYAFRTYHSTESNSMPNVISEMHQLLLPTLGNDNALGSYTKTVIDECTGKVTDTTSAMNAYLLIENYFLTVVNYQFQAATVMVNAANMVDNGGEHGYASTFWNNTMREVIPAEVGVFLSSVEYMVANLSEYRNSKRFIHDMKYAEAGLAPDLVFLHVLARAQFVANLLYDASGISYPRISGHIMVPNRYTTDGSGPDIPNELTITIGSVQIKSAGTKYESMIPYTRWSSEKTCHPANHWDLYRFTTVDPDTSWDGTPQIVKVVASGSNLPWPHSPDVEIKGTVTPLYYNLKDPSQRSPTRTEECSFQFGYFSANWQWGYMLLSNTKLQSKLHDDFNAANYDDRFQNLTVPVTSYDHYMMSSAPPFNCYSVVKSDAISFSHSEYSGGLLASGNLVGLNNSKAYCIVDARYLSVKTGSELPDADPETIEAWALYNGSIDNKKLPKKATISVSLGTRYSKTDGLVDLYHIYGNLMKDALDVNKAQFNIPTKFSSVEISTNTSYYPGEQYFYYVDEAYEPDKRHISIDLNYAYQFVYTGLYSLPDPPAK
ncbi:MAG: hypothetical protein HGA37_01940 [Lentimicrobium sp.]|nr:hypothetical protein [Lentimicrobium sp.]